MTPGRTRFVGTLLGTLALLMTGCAGGSNSLLPSGPSGTAAGRAQISGRVTGTTTNSVASTTSTGVLTTRALTAASTGLRVTISGTDISASVDGTGQFTLDGVPPGTVTLTFSGADINASLTLTGVNAGDRIEIEVRLEGTRAHLEADRRHHEGDADDDDDDDADGERDDDDREDGIEVEGPISELAGSCPMLTFTVAGRHVSTSDATSFRDTTCGALTNTVRVEVHGILNEDGTVAAGRVELDD